MSVLLTALSTTSTKHSAWHWHLYIQRIAAEWMDDIIALNVVCYTLYTEISIWYALSYHNIAFMHNITFVISLYYQWGYKGTKKWRQDWTPGCLFPRGEAGSSEGGIQNISLFSKFFKNFPFYFYNCLTWCTIINWWLVSKWY